jgi:hypothetical protein
MAESKSAGAGPGSSAHASRDRHLFGDGPKRILALDGGGVRGVITVAFLERLEQVLRKQTKTEGNLCDYFDLVGGTSTGAIIAGGVALGRTTADLKDIYHRLAPTVFERDLFRVPFLQAKFDVKRLRAEIGEIVKERTLDSPDLQTGFALIAKRLDTGSPWIVSNNPRAPYWDDPPSHSHTGNRHYSLANLVRASTAAPFYFDPEEVEITAGQKPGLFVDGGVSPHNNPSLALLMMALQKPFGLNWKAGADNLTLVSVGTGGYRYQVSIEELGRIPTPNIIYSAMMSMMDDAVVSVLTTMQWLGQTLTPWKINSEIGTLGNEVLPGGPMFRYLRYNVRLEAKWLEDHLEMKISDDDLHGLRKMDNPAIIPLAYEIGQRAAAAQINEDHWGDGPDRNKPSEPL